MKTCFHRGSFGVEECAIPFLILVEWIEAGPQSWGIRR